MKKKKAEIRHVFTRDELLRAARQCGKRSIIIWDESKSIDPILLEQLAKTFQRFHKMNKDKVIIAADGETKKGMSYAGICIDCYRKILISQRDNIIKTLKELEK